MIPTESHHDRNGCFEFRVYCEPMAYVQPRAAIVPADGPGGFVLPRSGRTGRAAIRMHPDPSNVAYKEEVRLALRASITEDCKRVLREGPILMNMWIFRTRPRSVKTMYPDCKPDRTSFLRLAEDAVRDALRTVVGCDAKGRPTVTAGFDDAQVVSGRVELRWAYINYRDCGREAPGLIIHMVTLNVDDQNTLNADYWQYLKQNGLEYAKDDHGNYTKKPAIVRARAAASDRRHEGDDV